MVQHRKGHMPAGTDAALLKSLMSDAPHLYLDRRGHVKSHLVLEVPVNEWNIPQPRKLIEQTLGVVASSHVWIGRNDVHHLAWPFSAYRDLSTDDLESVGEAYRSTAGVKVRVKRQMHDHFHLMPPPAVPDEEVMVQYLYEEASGRQLAKTLALSDKERTEAYIDDDLECERYDRYLELLSRTRESMVGHLPTHQSLQTYTADEARTSLGGMLRILDMRSFSTPTVTLANETVDTV